MRKSLAPVLLGIGAFALAACGGNAERRVTGPDRSLTYDVPRVVRLDCRLAAGQTTAPVHCPPLVPRGKTTSQNRSSRGRPSIDAHRGQYTLNFVSRVIEGFDPDQPSGFRRHEGHWLVAASPSPSGLTSGPGTMIVERRNVQGVRVTIVERRWVAYHLDAGHVLAIWPFYGRTFELSVHGFENRDLLLEMVAAMIARMRR